MVNESGEPITPKHLIGRKSASAHTALGFAVRMKRQANGAIAIRVLAKDEKEAASVMNDIADKCLGGWREW